MASAINVTIPPEGSPTTAGVRANFTVVKSEIETLQTQTAALITAAQGKKRHLGIVGGSTGDRHSDQNGTVSVDISSDGFFNWANWRLGNPFRLIRNGAVSGRHTDVVLENLASDILNADVGYVAVMAGGNDVAAGKTYTEIAGNLHQIYQRLLDNNMIPLIFTISPAAVAYPSAISNVFSRVNDWIREYPTRQNGLFMFDTFRVTNAPLNPTQWRSGYSVDGGHAVAPGASAIGLPLATALATELGIAQMYPRCSGLSDTWVNSNSIGPGGGVNLYDGVSLMQGTSGSTANLDAPGCTFTLTDAVPGTSATDKITLSAFSNGVAGMACTVTTPVNANGYGDDLVLALTASAAGQYMLVGFSNVASKATSGYWYQPGCGIDIVGGSIRPSAVATLVAMSAGLSIRSSAGWEINAPTVGIGEDATGMFQQALRWQYLAAYGFLQLAVKIQFQSAGTCTIKLRQAELREYTGAFQD